MRAPLLTFQGWARDKEVDRPLNLKNRLVYHNSATLSAAERPPVAPASALKRRRVRCHVRISPLVAAIGVMRTIAAAVLCLASLAAGAEQRCGLTRLQDSCAEAVPPPPCVVPPHCRLSVAAQLMLSASITFTACGPVPVAGLACEAWCNGPAITRGEAVPVFLEKVMLERGGLNLKSQFRGRHLVPKFLRPGLAFCTK